MKATVKLIESCLELVIEEDEAEENWEGYYWEMQIKNGPKIEGHQVLKTKGAAKRNAKVWARKFGMTNDDLTFEE